MTQSIQIKEQHFTLHYSGAIFWEEEKILLIADVHFGKVAHFRKNGIAIPQVAAEKNIRDLNEVLDFFPVEKVFFLGDLFHSSKNTEWTLFEEWCRNCSAEITLIAGNHDIIQRRHYEVLHIQVVEEVVLAGFLFTHFPSERPGHFVFCGHVHPGIKLRGTGRQSMSLACFFQTQQQMILPAFGAFTGKHLLRPKEEDVVYAIAQESVVLIE